MILKKISGSTEPKTNWSSNDKFNIEDYNRILNNINLIAKTATEVCRKINIHDMGEPIKENAFSGYWNVKCFNAFEENVDILGEALGKDYGIGKTFYENGVFIDWIELNRIESATLDMLKRLDNELSALERLDFRFGNFNGLKI